MKKRSEAEWVKELGKSIPPEYEDEVIYTIKFLDEETGVYMSADTTQSYEADSELDALKQFAQVHKEDLLIEDLKIVSEDPFVLWVKGWAEAEDHSKFEIVKGEFEYIAVEEI